MASPLRLQTRSLALRQLSQSPIQSAPRRFASSHGHDSHAHAAPSTESFGKSFYFTLLMIPAGYIAYQISVNANSSPEGGLIGRTIRAYGDLKSTWTERNALHTKMVEQAGHDRNLFYNARMPNHIDLKAPEQVFNGGSPYNVPAGHSVNLEKVIAHYREEAARDEESKAAKREAAAAAADSQMKNHRGV